MSAGRQNGIPLTIFWNSIVPGMKEDFSMEEDFCIMPWRTLISMQGTVSHTFSLITARESNR